MVNEDDSHWQIAHEYLAAEVAVAEEKLRAAREAPSTAALEIARAEDALDTARQALEDNDGRWTMEQLGSLVLPDD